MDIGQTAACPGSGVVVDEQGREWWSTAFACVQLGVSPARLRDWVYRSQREPAFPRIDPPRRRGRTAAYLASQLLEAEAHTALSGRGRRRAS